MEYLIFFKALHRNIDHEVQNITSKTIIPPHISKTDLFASFESIFKSMTSRLRDKNNENKLKSDICYLAHLYANSYKLSPKDIKTYKILKNLHKNSNIVSLKPDKGDGVVVLKRADYIEGILNIINETHEFKELDNYPTIIRETKLQRFLRDLTKAWKN